MTFPASLEYFVDLLKCTLLCFSIDLCSVFILIKSDIASRNFKQRMLGMRQCRVFVRPCRRLDNGESTRLGEVRPYLDSRDGDAMHRMVGLRDRGVSYR